MKREDEARYALLAITLLLVLGSLWTLLPFVGPLILAAWAADLARPLWRRVSQRLRWGGGAAAGVVTSLLVLLVMVPVTLVLVNLASGAVGLARSLLQSDGARQALLTVVSPEGGGEGSHFPKFDLGTSLQFLRENGERAWGIVESVLGATATGVLAGFVFVLGLHVFLSDGAALYRWLEDHAPLPAGTFQRFASAFRETGRGMFAGVVLTGLLQAAIATVTYFAIGVPRALVLGFVTFIASFIPSVGTAFVWTPIALGLFLTGRTGAAVALTIVGVGVIGTVDNALRPILTRVGNLDMSAFLLLLVMLGGAAVFGGWGIVLGPLLTRLALEGVAILKGRRASDAA